MSEISYAHFPNLVKSRAWLSSWRWGRDRGCGGGVQVIRESPDSGVVRYLYKGNDGHLYTSKRDEAFDKIQEFCGGPYQVLKEGQTKGRQRRGYGRSEVVRAGGIRFQCTMGRLSHCRWRLYDD